MQRLDIILNIIFDEPISHFQVILCLFFKTSPRASPREKAFIEKMSLICMITINFISQVFTRATGYHTPKCRAFWWYNPHEGTGTETTKRTQQNQPKDTNSACA